ncbi:MAG: EAL domain-containing protein [Sedimenticola sp.]|nr:EAL domain-containing protein [Sedimenticola sp.]
MGTGDFCLSADLFAEAFPFHLVINRQLQVVQAGRSLLKHCPSLVIGGLFTAAFRVQRPDLKTDFTGICASRNKIFLIASLDVEDLYLKGQMMLDEARDCLYFIGSPWLHANTELKQFGLKLKDFALHDPAADFLFLFKSNRAALDDTTQLANRLREEKEWAQVTLGSIGDGVIATSTDGRVNYMNQTAEQMTGRAHTEVKGQRLEAVLNLVDEITRHSHADFLAKALEDKEPVPMPTPSLLLQADGEAHVVEGVLTPILDGQGGTHGMVIVFHDISDRQHLIRQLEFHSTHDHLTNLPNRMLLYDRATQSIAQARRHIEQVALMFLDLDRFKTINDSLGHQIGDQLLKLVAGRLSSVVRETDTVCRLGGDEFVILISEIDQCDFVGQVAEKVLDVLRAPFHVSGYVLTISASIGVSKFPEDADDVNRLLKHADLAMYQAKTRGRNNIQFFDRSMDQRAESRLSLENSLRLALKRDELQLYFQPKLAIASGRLTGFEALLRWHSREHGTVPPDRFIPIAEETGLIVPIGEWVINEACRQVSEWRQAGFSETPVAVNISLIQLTRVDLEKVLVDALHRNQLTPDLIELEFTESVLLQDFEMAMDVLQRLHGLGFTLTIDDFGVGYSSLNYLNRLPIDVLKIDRSFVNGACEDRDAEAIVRAVVNLSHDLDICVIAEGCETEQQLNYLKQIACDQVQGYLISRPMPAEEITPFLEADYLYEKCVELDD